MDSAAIAGKTFRPAERLVADERCRRRNFSTRSLPGGKLAGMPARGLENFDRYESLPPWAQATLAEHVADERPNVYTLAEFAAAATHDALWNAAQNQLLREGRIHNYLRMVWGKKILEWSALPQEALQILLELNNRYALDGQDPNSYSGIFWIFGRYDRPWAPSGRFSAASVT